MNARGIRKCYTWNRITRTLITFSVVVAHLSNSNQFDTDTRYWNVSKQEIHNDVLILSHLLYLHIFLLEIKVKKYTEFLIYFEYI